MPERTCTNGDCRRPHYARELCKPCYSRLRSYGDPNYTPRRAEIIDGLRRSDWEKIDKRPDGCWYWTGAVARLHGYGRVTFQGVTQDAHRYVWLRMVGPVPEGLELDHLCRVRHCVNPDHLEPVTHRENVMRGEALSRYNAEKTHCKCGREYVTGMKGGRAHRRCPPCDAEAAREWRARQKAEAVA